MLVDDVDPLWTLTHADGYELKELWSENIWIETDAGKIPTAFVLIDPAEREIDAHAMRIDGDGRGIPAWTTDVVLTHDDLSGEGSIDGYEVRCMSAAMQLTVHAGYELPDEQKRDIELLKARFEL